MLKVGSEGLNLISYSERFCNPDWTPLQPSSLSALAIFSVVGSCCQYCWLLSGTLHAGFHLCAHQTSITLALGSAHQLWNLFRQHLDWWQMGRVYWVCGGLLNWLSSLKWPRAALNSFIKLFDFVFKGRLHFCFYCSRFWSIPSFLTELLAGRANINPPFTRLQRSFICSCMNISEIAGFIDLIKGTGKLES